MHSTLAVHTELIQELNEMAVEDWILFRSKLPTFEDFVAKWRAMIPT
jgi:hypothetical protein